MKKLLLLCLYLLGGLYARSQAGTPDSGFAGKGWTYTDFIKSNNYEESGLQVLLQADGSYILLLQAGSAALLTRYLADGTMDLGYGTEGFSARARMQPTGAARQPDGKIVVAGSYRKSNTEPMNFTLVRYNEEGTLDLSFGTGGVVSTGLGGDAYAAAVALQPDGKIVVSGSVPGPGGSDVGLVRYYANGALDSSFGEGGVVVTDFGEYDYPAAVALQADGKIVVAGTSSGAVGHVFALARYNSDGTPDQTLDGDGRVTTAVGEFDSAIDLAIQGDGRLVVAGFTFNQETRADFVLLRFHVDGALDNSFDGDGKLVTDFFSDWDYPGSLAIQPDGKLVVAGRAGNPRSNSTDFALVRYNAGGDPDNSFGAEGKVLTDFLGADGANFVALQNDGKLVVAGATGYLDNYTLDFALLRYNPDGSPDNSFSGDGKVAGYYPVAVSANFALAVQSDGKVVVGGRANPEQSRRADFGLARYGVDGAPDPSFGTEGTVVTDFFGNLDQLTAVALQADGKIVAAGYAIYDPVTGRHDFALARYNTDGTLDPTFDGDGKVTTAFTELIGRVAAVAVQPDGKIVVAGTALHPGGRHLDFALVRYNSDGSLDAGFGEGGMVLTDFWGDDDQVSSMVIQSDGRLVVAGTAAKPGTYESFVLARYTPEGVLDHSFGEGGWLTTDFGSWTVASSLAIQKDGKLVVAGRYYNPTTYTGDLALARYYPGGLPDSSFDGDGRLTVGFREHDWITSLALQGDGKIIVAGRTRSEGKDNLDMLLYRIGATGAPDTTFGKGGVVIQDIGFYDFAEAIAVWGKRLYMAGWIIQEVDRGLVAAYLTGCGDTEICGNRLDDNCDGQVDEGCSAQPFLTINDVTVSEDLQRATLMVTLSKKMSEPVSFSYFTVDRTATSKANRKGVTDYVAKSGTLTIPAGQQTAVISINIIDDNSAEGEEYFDVHLQRPVGAALNGDKGRVTIQDGEPSVGIFVTTPAPEKESLQTLSVTARPNPSAGAFTLVLQGNDRSPVTIKVTDASGRLVDAKAGITPNSTLHIGSNYRPGVYHAEVVQGQERVNLKLVKQ
ncbi:MAG TPA: Calx-beta domain-containing protein [Chitinophagaceae bacterium]